MEKHDYILKVGTVRSVQGRKINVLVDKRKNAPHILLNGEVLKNVAVGSYLKITKGFSELIGKIEGEAIEEDKSASNKTYFKESDKINRELIVSLVGFIENGKFYQGVKELPLIENECFLLRREEFDMVHKFVDEDSTDDSIKIGVLASETGVSIELGVNNLFASHIGIFGNTGSGKSYTLAKLYHELFRKYKERDNFKKNAKFILIDFNGEYVNPKTKKEDFPDIIVEEEFKEEWKLSTSLKNGADKFPVSSNILKDLNFWAILLKATEQTQKPFLDRALNSSFLNENVRTNEGLKKVISTNLKNFLTDIKHNQDIKLHISFLEDLNQIGDGNIFENLDTLISLYNTNLKFFSDNNGKRFYFNTDTGNYNSNDNVEDFYQNVIHTNVENIQFVDQRRSELELIHLMIVFNYYFSIHKGYIHKDFISPLIGRLNSKIKEVNVEMRKIIPLIIAKEYYEKHKKENSTRKKYLNIIIDEAHNILSSSSNRESETWKDYRLETFEEIIKEGRKFGVFLTIASQRPFDISTTIISQLHNYFLHRLINNKDIEAIEKTVSYLDKVSFESIPILPRGNCVLAGLSAQLPVVVKIDEIGDDKEGDEYIKRYSPYNETIRLTDNWK